MNMILSLLVCIAMLCNGGAPLPAQPETRTDWVIRNVVISNDEQEIALDQEFNLSFAGGSEAVSAAFSVTHGTQNLLPVSGTVTADELLFSLCTGNVYSVNSETLEAVAGLTEADMEAMQVFDDIVADMSAMNWQDTLTPDYIRTVNPEATRIEARACGGEISEEEIEVDGVTYTAEKYVYTLDASKAGAVYDALIASDLEGVSWLAEYNAAVMAATGAETGMTPQDIVQYQVVEDDFFYEEVFINSLSDEGGRTESHNKLTDTLDSRSIEMYSAIEQADGSCIVMEAAGGTTGPIDAVETIKMDFRAVKTKEIDMDSAYDNACYRTEEGVEIALDAKISEGLISGSMDARYSNSYGNVIGSTVSTTVEAVDMHFGLEQRAGEDGGVISAWTIRFEDGVTPLEVRFDLHSVTGEYAPFLPEAEALALTGDGTGAGDIKIAADAIIFAAGAVQLSADEKFAALEEMFAREEDAYDDVYEYYSSVAEGAAAFGGILKDFTPPEGYKLESVMADGYALIVNCEKPVPGSDYVNTVRVYCYTEAYGGSSFYNWEDGKAVPVQQDVLIEMHEPASYGDGDSLSGNFYLHTPEGFLYFYTDDYSMELAEEIIAGVELN